MDWSAKLRRELSQRAQAWAEDTGLPHYKSLGANPTILFEPSLNPSRHGNFAHAAWDAIASNASWQARLRKQHSQSQALPEDKRANACELDSSNSSDALLMSCFCFPGAVPRILRGLDLPMQGAVPVFGHKPELELSDGSKDRTEIDMLLGGIIFEAKLTEKDFTSRPESHVRRYKRLEETFDLERIPRNGGVIVGYQLIRNVLAAAHLGALFVVLIDQRRPDLLREWWEVHAAIRAAELRARCTIRTWQEVAASCPTPLADYLRVKYGL